MSNERKVVRSHIENVILSIYAFNVIKKLVVIITVPSPNLKTNRTSRTTGQLFWVGRLLQRPRRIKMGAWEGGPWDWPHPHRGSVAFLGQRSPPAPAASSSHPGRGQEVTNWLYRIVAGFNWYWLVYLHTVCFPTNVNNVGINLSGCTCWECSFPSEKQHNGAKLSNLHK